ncbi:hypothetical protein [Nocardiopsis quinghaiensis]|uniref:hypothetical protein n=1 Tax=Nocardiopsis quinghaiensis TaxID=464995 RepID=UPI0012389FAC|nr:hypothetical protein [Nocardiopsis quinghaiensis]
MRPRQEPPHDEDEDEDEALARMREALGALGRALWCPYGHDMTDPPNVYVRASGKRECRTCRRESARSRRAERGRGANE